jgi:flagellar biogenesis protein FliO
MELAQAGVEIHVESRSTESRPMEITQTPSQTSPALAAVLARTFTHTSKLAAARFKVFSRFIVSISRAGIKRQRKSLSVRETAALGDRRSVSVIQFEHQRFLIGSSPNSVTLLSRLPDDFAGGESDEGKTGAKN